MANTPSLTSQHTRDMEKEICAQMQALMWSKDKLKHEREKRLKNLLLYAKENSQWYKRALASFNIENFTEERLAELPILNKKILMHYWDEIVTNKNLTLSIADAHLDEMLTNKDALYLQNHYHVLASGGSSGRRGVFIYNWNEWNTYYLMFRRYRLYKDNPRALLDPSKKVKLAIVSTDAAASGIYSLSKTYKSRYTKIFHIPSSLHISAIVEQLNEIQPDVLQGYPFIIHTLTKEQNIGSLSISPSTINVFAEPFYESIRIATKAAWPTAGIFNTYGTSEGLAALNCTGDRTEMHINEDLCIVEPVNSCGMPVKPGTRSSKAYITNLFNYTLPLIRYELNDEILFLDKTCDCGNQHQLIAEPIDRAEYVFHYSNGTTVRHMALRTAFFEDKYIQEYQIIQTSDGVNVKLLTSGPANKEHLKSMLDSRLKNLGLENPTIKLTEVEKFEYLASGKLRRFIPLTNHS